VSIDRSDYSTLRCSYCGLRLTTTEDNAGDYIVKADGAVILHTSCAGLWEKEYEQHCKAGAA
jgi:hypothetical protein